MPITEREKIYAEYGERLKEIYDKYPHNSGTLNDCAYILEERKMREDILGKLKGL